jgi:gamma-glutamyltranspeptidase/glutathione hydrolase
MGSIAVPGVVAGLFSIHQDLCRLPLSEIIAPAVDLARSGIRINTFQSYISQILLPILEASDSSMRLVATDEAPGQVAATGSRVFHRELADVLEALVLEGEDLFYQGELAQRLVSDCRESGGHLLLNDLESYRVIQREPVRFSSHGADFSLNSPPSPGGGLVAFALGLLDGSNLATHRWGHRHHCVSMAGAMQAAGELRRSAGLDMGVTENQVIDILGREHLKKWRESMQRHTGFSRGTTHISVADSEGNLASLAVSNGEGCAYVIPGSGIMLNNMLGEEDLSPAGFHQWQENTRMASMMCPSVVHLPDGGLVALGSGGSNRIRSAVLQVLTNLFEFDMNLEEAVAAPRMHLEGDFLSVEDGYSPDAIEALLDHWPEHKLWPEPNMFFGGVHAVERLPDGSFKGAGDPRRGGRVSIAGSGDYS